jgi:4-hydroxybenzoate polyprenyltransferase
MDHRPLCVDVDSLLGRVNLLAESLLGSIKRRPIILALLPLWVLSGRAAFKSRLASLADIDASVVPYPAEAVSVIRNVRNEGRQVWLITRNHLRYAKAIGDHLGPFDRILAATDEVNLAERDKGLRLEQLLGAGGFEHLTFKPSKASPGSQIRTWLKAIRLHQWAKNALIFVPVVTAHAVLDFPIVLSAFIAFLSMGLCASATYIVNDLLDLESDRHHARKRRRPFASGALSAKAGLAMALTLLAIGLAFAAMLPVGFMLILLTYIVVTLLYSFWFKRIASLDVMTLAGLYTLRVIAGALATGIKLSFWLLAFSLFLFLCLALAKRVAELIEHGRLVEANQRGSRDLRGREYTIDDTQMLQTLGSASGYIAVLILALYINSPEVASLYATPWLLWLIAPVMLLWITRLWVVTSRGYMNEDPISFAIRDPETWATAAFTGLVLVAAANWRYS